MSQVHRGSIAEDTERGSGYTGKWGGQEREVATFLSSWILFDALSLLQILPTTALSPLAVVPFFLFKCFN